MLYPHETCGLHVWTSYIYTMLMCANGVDHPEEYRMHKWCYLCIYIRYKTCSCKCISIFGATKVKILLPLWVDSSARSHRLRLFCYCSSYWRYMNYISIVLFSKICRTSRMRFTSNIIFLYVKQHRKSTGTVQLPLQVKIKMIWESSKKWIQRIRTLSTLLGSGLETLLIHTITDFKVKSTFNKKNMIHISLGPKTLIKF